MTYVYTGTDLVPTDEYLAHYGILRQKWGVRRFQNYDGTLTPAGRERYHKMIATNVNRDKMRRYTDAPGGIGDWYHNRNRRKVQKEIQKEFEATSEGKRLAEANKKLSKIQGRMNNRDDAYKDPENGVLAKTVNRIGQDADKNRMAGALAEQNEAQKAAAKIYDELREKHKEEILDATIKDLKIYVVDDGREWLEKYIRGDDDATFSKVSRKQARAEAKEAAQNRREGKESEKQDDPKYIKKVEENGDTRYFYDKDELKASYLNAAKQLNNIPNRYDLSKREIAVRDKANDEITNVAKKAAQASELKAIGADAKKLNQEMVKEYRSWYQENRSKLSGMDAYANAWNRYVGKDPKLSKLDKQLDEHRQAYYDAAKREAYKILGTHESSYETDLLASRIGNMYYSEIGEDRSK